MFEIWCEYVQKKPLQYEKVTPTIPAFIIPCAARWFLTEQQH